MFTLTEIFSIIIIHFIGDFVLQTDKQAKGKSKNWRDLLSHTSIYSLCWWIIGLIYMSFKTQSFPIKESLVPLFLFVLITFIAHTITDYFTSRLNSRL